MRQLEAPVFVGASRVDAALALLAAHPSTDIIVCDDGLQHLALQRDVAICVMDERGLGNGRLQPAGPLREHWPYNSHAGIRAQCPSFFLLHRGNFEEGFAVQRELATYALRSDGSPIPLSELKHQKLTALAGIAQPENFFSLLRSSGLSLQETFPLPDHYNFNSNPRIFHAGQP
ncbi:MAG: tetraacyldisaccharide 4'-kinase [Brachymonas sp.]|nr:tetraacyldisaccharide 4'-kinase [Brachymonas sp.]